MTPFNLRKKFVSKALLILEVEKAFHVVSVLYCQIVYFISYLPTVQNTTGSGPQFLAAMG